MIAKRIHWSLIRAWNRNRKCKFLEIAQITFAGGVLVGIFNYFISCETIADRVLCLNKSQIDEINHRLLTCSVIHCGGTFILIKFMLAAHKVMEFTFPARLDEDETSISAFM